jgi:hypothetical protein
VIKQVHNAALNIISLGIKPNLILLNVGTNDCIGRTTPANNPATAPDRLKSLIQSCLDGMPQVAIIVSTLLPNSDAGTDACVVRVNSGIKSMVLGLNDPKVILADMHDGLILKSDRVDGTHPGDLGYEKMATIWFTAFSTFVDQISSPENNGIPDGKGLSDQKTSSAATSTIGVASDSQILMSIASVMLFFLARTMTG